VLTDLVLLSDAGYGASAAFRCALNERWAALGGAAKGSACVAGGIAAEGVGIPRNQKVYGSDVTLIQPSGRKRRPGRIRNPGRRKRSWPGKSGGV